MPKLVLIDGNALLHRGYHALPPTIKNKKGEILNAVYGFSMIFLNVLEKLKPEYVCACFDMKSPTFRHKECKTYKAHRKAGPDELYAQLPRIKDVLNTFNIPIYEKKGYEADDLIGTLATKNIQTKTKEKVEIIVVTGDLDALQLVNENVKVFTFKQGIKETVLYTIEKVQQRFQLNPSQLVDYKALAGDVSDNIKGIKGVGPKTAAGLLNIFGSLKKIYKEMEQKNWDLKKISAQKRKFLKPVLLENLKKGKADALLSKKLAQMVLDVPIKFDLEKCRLEDYDTDKVLKLFQELEFNSLVRRLPAGKQTETELFYNKTKKKEYKIVKNLLELKEMTQVLKSFTEISLDLKTNPKNEKLEGIAFSTGKQSFYTPIRYQNKKIIYGTEDPLDILQEILTDEKIQKTAHNAKWILKIFAQNNSVVKNITFDTMLSAYLLDSGKRNYALEGLIFNELGKRKNFLETKKDAPEKTKPATEMSILNTGMSNMENAQFILRLKKYFLKKLARMGKLGDIFQKIEMPLVYVLRKMERAGIKIDNKYLEKMSIKMKVDLKELEEQIFILAGENFNLNSPKQLEKILFEKMKLPARGIRRTKTGYSTAQSELEKLRNKHEIIFLIERYRELAKLVSTYIDALPKIADQKTWRVHTDFNQTITATGRLSSSHPNLQNIPVRKKEGQAIRRAFIAEKGWKLLAIDYSQIELRLAAHLSEDPTMIQAFLNNEDIHRRTAAELNNVKMEDVTDTMRYEAKTINFGVLYGMGAYGLAQGLKINTEQAQNFIDNYFNDFPKLREYLDCALEKARDRGFVETLFGRRRYLPELNSNTQFLRSQAERMAINMPIQGLAADVIKLAMIRIDKKFKDLKDIKMLLQVHDELVFEIKNNLIKKYTPMICKIMESVYQFKVPLKVEAKFGKNWGEMEVI